MSRKCPCYGCMDRNATCHMKGKCPHGFDEWNKEQEQRREMILKAKCFDVPHWTKANEQRHFNWIKKGQGNTKR